MKKVTLTLTDELDLDTKEKVLPQGIACEIWMLCHLPFKHCGNWFFFFPPQTNSQTKKQTEKKTDRAKTICPDLSMLGHKMHHSLCSAEKKKKKKEKKKKKKKKKPHTLYFMNYHCV